jgi:hypothetical protein
MKTNLMHNLSSFYFFTQPLHVSVISVVHHQEVYCIYTVRTNCCIYSITPDDGLKICPKHVEVDWRNKLRINCASSWVSLHGCIEQHGQQNTKYRNTYSLVIWDSNDTQCSWRNIHKEAQLEGREGDEEIHNLFCDIASSILLNPLHAPLQ